MPTQFVYDSLQEADITLKECKWSHELSTRERSSCLKKQILAERIECDWAEVGVLEQKLNAEAKKRTSEAETWKQQLNAVACNAKT